MHKLSPQEIEDGHLTLDLFEGILDDCGLGRKTQLLHILFHALGVEILCEGVVDTCQSKSLETFVCCATKEMMTWLKSGDAVGEWLLHVGGKVEHLTPIFFVISVSPNESGVVCRHVLVAEAANATHLDGIAVRGRTLLACLSLGQILHGVLFRRNGISGCRRAHVNEKGRILQMRVCTSTLGLMGAPILSLVPFGRDDLGAAGTTTFWVGIDICVKG